VCSHRVESLEVEYLHGISRETFYPIYYGIFNILLILPATMVACSEPDLAAEAILTKPKLCMLPTVYITIREKSKFIKLIRPNR
jgi:hypothetical protein